jgi:predicted phosphodiesterase
MRVFALSDVHADYDANVRWLTDLSSAEHQDDLLVLAGDVSDSLETLERTFRGLRQRFGTVVYVPGNHDLWVRGDASRTSLEKFEAVCGVAEDCGVSTSPVHRGALTVVPLLGWYDYSFGEPSDELNARWADFRACRWPESFDAAAITSWFLQRNEHALAADNETVISFSHFLPRIDVMPAYIPAERRMLYPVLGSTRIEDQIRVLQPDIHVYGHSHVNRRVRLDGIDYVNNALGYPQEKRIAARELVCIHDA